MKRNIEKSKLETPEIKSSPLYRPFLERVKSEKEQLKENFANNVFSRRGWRWTERLHLFICYRNFIRKYGLLFKSKLKTECFMVSG